MDNTAFSHSNHSSNNPHSTAYPPIASPGQLLANLPGILGFYPKDSVIFVALERSGNALALGPVIRVDAHETEDALEQVSHTLLGPDCELVFAFIVGSFCGHHLDHIADVLFDASFNDDYLEVDAAWATHSVQVGQKYHMVFGPTGPNGEGLMQDWVEGRIPNITDSASMRHCVEANTLPELDRADLFAPFQDRNPHVSPADAAGMARTAKAVAQELRQAGAKEPQEGIAGSPHRFLEDAALALSEVTTLEETLRDADSLTTFGVWMATTWTRDLVVAELLDQPDAACTALLAAAQTFTGTMRANALALYAGVSVTCGRGMYTSPALVQSLEEAPEHTLSNLLFSGYRAGMVEWMVDNLREGSMLARTRAFAEYHGDDTQDLAA